MNRPDNMPTQPDQLSHPCPVCGQGDLMTVTEVSGAPVHVGILWQSREAALACPKGDIYLGYCPGCGFVTNCAFRSALLEYVEGYDNPLDFSPVFQEYSRSLASDLIERYNLKGKQVLEIGCGKGDFLNLISEMGGNRGIGFDPSYSGPEKEGDVFFIRDMYSRQYAHVPADLIFCRQTYEHIEDPGGFLAELAATIGDRPVPVFVEVPDLRYIIRSKSVWDIIYEHCSYFSTESLSRVFTNHGFRITHTTGLFADQFLGLHAILDKNPGRLDMDLTELTGEVTRFARVFDERVDGWSRRLAELADKDRRAVVWGAGARGTSFVNMVNDRGCISAIVDINPRKQGCFLGGTGHPIVPPDTLTGIDPDLVIVMNPIYLPEIRHDLTRLGIKAEVVAA